MHLLTAPFRRTVVAVAVVAAFSTLAAAPASARTRDDYGNNVTTPTPGITCTETIYPESPSGIGYAYKAKCTGTPIGIGRSYKYREVITCDYAGATGTSFGPYKQGGKWSIPLPCPDALRALTHRVQLTWI